MDKKTVTVTLKIRSFHLKWLVRNALECGIYQEVFGNSNASEELMMVLIYLANSDELCRVRCEAIRNLSDKQALKEMSVNNTYLEAREMAKKRLRELNIG